MAHLPEKIIPATQWKIRLPLILLWIIIFPLICFLLYLIHYEFSQGESISNNVFIAILLGGFLLGITYLNERHRQQPVTLTTDGIKVIHYNKTKFIAWSEVSHIEEAMMIWTQTIWLHLDEGQNLDEYFRGKNRWKKHFYNADILNISTMHLGIPHNEVLNLVDTYFQNSKSF